VADTRNDPTSRELVADYFEPLHIGATLDVPIYRGGKVFGILCCELIDGVRDWSERERDFCTAVAELISRAFEQNDRIEAEKRLARAERSRHEAEKMEALGRMAAAVAHDFNNILGVIQLLTDTLARQDNDPAGRAHTLKLLREATDSGQRLTRKLMACARSDSITLTKVRLRTIVEGMRSMIESLVAPSRLVIDYSDDDDSILADQVGIEQILINLASNARDAIGPREGTVTIRVRRSRNFVELSVQDDGEGMDEYTRARIFEPFFSTRPNKSHAGLGMSTVFRIVEAHHARINVHSTLGQGTQIEVLFPVCASDEATQLQP
jgi:signal transduction histidine kinase